MQDNPSDLHSSSPPLLNRVKNIVNFCSVMTCVRCTQEAGRRKKAVALVITLASIIHDVAKNRFDPVSFLQGSHRVIISLFFSIPVGASIQVATSGTPHHLNDAGTNAGRNGGSNGGAGTNRLNALLLAYRPRRYRASHSRKVIAFVSSSGRDVTAASLPGHGVYADYTLVPGGERDRAEGTIVRCGCEKEHSVADGFVNRLFDFWASLIETERHGNNIHLPFLGSIGDSLLRAVSREMDEKLSIYLHSQYVPL